MAETGTFTYRPGADAGLPKRIASHFPADLGFRWLTAFCAALIPLVVGGILVELVRHSYLSLGRFGWDFLLSQTWNPVTGEFGAASSIYGTLVSTGIALLLAVPLSLAIALFLVELAPEKLSGLAGGVIELLAAIPSIIYGMWGLFIFAPFMADHVQPVLSRVVGFLPLFTGPPMGIGMLTAGIILALMILPYMAAIIRDVFRLVPEVMKESAYGLGATTWEVARKVTMPYGLVGITGAVFLGLARALVETMAVTFVIGNDHRIAASLFAAGNSIASTLANEFSEASETLYLSALVELALVLFAITVLVQVLSQLMLRRIYRARGGGA